MKIILLEQTCSGCPTQFSGQTDNGDDVYIRFRWGHLQIDVNHKPIYSEQIGHPYDGFISLDEIKEKVKHLNIEWP
jgi:hypothetical protein